MLLLFTKLCLCFFGFYVWDFFPLANWEAGMSFDAEPSKIAMLRRYFRTRL